MPRTGNHRIYVLSLGCFKNTVDSENMIADLVREGFSVVSDPADADVIVVNTCGFIDPAKEESIEAVLEASSYRKTGTAELLVVVGCLVQRYKSELQAWIPEVDLFLDLEEEVNIAGALVELLGRPVREGEAGAGTDRIALTPRHLAFLKIAEGCSRHCTFCSIPAIRGPYRSRDAGDLVEEALKLESAGVSELTVISQDTVSYADRKGRRLVDLVESLLARTAVPWIRLLYLNPGEFPESLIGLLAREERLLGYVDLPIQHITTPVLERMGRNTDRAGIERLIESLRQRVEGLVLRTTILVGFPGEREEDFEELLEFVEAVRFERLGGFVFSCEEGTPAARLPDQVPDEVRQDRLDRLMDLQRRISREHCRGRVGKTVTVLVDGEVPPDEPVSELLDGVPPEERVRYVGRSRCEAYEVDGAIYLVGRFSVGEFAKVEIIDSGDYDLLAKWSWA